mmetsp:Transcript_7528/g.10406  ORF Transcript_7528/g.10406 Transcript_7528/m.10406 type:complete len:152 (+) Transcript_7528:354-809(+)
MKTSLLLRGTHQKAGFLPCIKFAIRFTKVDSIWARWCGICDLPAELVQAIHLKKLDVRGNEIRELPEFLRDLKLEHLDVSSNKITQIPNCLGTFFDKLSKLFICCNPEPYGHPMEAYKYCKYRFTDVFPKEGQLKQLRRTWEVKCRSHQPN